MTMHVGPRVEKSLVNLGMFGSHPPQMPGISRIFPVRVEFCVFSLLGASIIWQVVYNVSYFYVAIS